MIRTASTVLTGEENASEPGSGIRPANGSLVLAHAASPVEHPSTLAPSRDRHTGTATRSEPGATPPAIAAVTPTYPPGVAAPSFVAPLREVVCAGRPNLTSDDPRAHDVTVSMIRSYRYRLYPTAEQSEAFTRWCGCARAIYNAGLEQRMVAYEDYGVSLGYNDQGKGLGDLKAAIPYLAEPHSDVLQQALRDLDRAYRNFFAGRTGYPQYHKRGHGDSFRIQNGGRPGHRPYIRVRRLNRRWGAVLIPKLGWVRFRWSRKPVGAIRHVTVSRDALGWHVSMCCDRAERPPTAHVGPPVGVDRGVVATVALSTGEMRSCPALSPGEANRKRRLERKAGRQETARRHRPNDQRRRSARHQRTLNALAKLKAREARIRKDFAHKLTTDLAKNHGVVVIEDLRIGNMTRSTKGTVDKPGVRVAQKRGLNRAILARGWGQIGVFLAYKVPAAGGALVKIPAPYTSQTCVECGAVDAASRSTQARFACTTCGHAAHADVNAARNILAAGLAVTARGADSEEAVAVNREPLDGLADVA